MIAASTHIDAIPRELRERPQWVRWRTATRNRKSTKLPVQPSGKSAKTNDPSTWFELQACLTGLSNGKADGIGYVFAADDPYFGIDLDACYDPASGTLTDWAREIIAAFRTYTEISPSGNGVKLVGRGRIADGKGRVCKLEDVQTFGAKAPEIACYDRSRFWAMSGKHLDGTPAIICDCQAALDALCARSNSKTKGKASANGSANDHASGDVSRRMLGINVPPENDGSRRLLTCCCICVEHDLSDTDAIAAIRSYASERPFPSDWTDQEIIRRLRDAEQQTERGSAATAGRSSPVAQHEFRTDVANADRLVRLHGDTIRYVGPWEKWIVFDGKRWRIDSMCEIERLSKDVGRQLFQHIGKQLTKKNDEWIDAEIRWAKYSLKSAGIGNMIRMARSEVAIDHHQLDSDPWLLNVENGTIDLRTGELHPHRRDDYLSKLAPVSFDPKADCPVWLRFLRRILDGDEGLQKYLQRLVGYCLTGCVHEHVLPVLCGTGANGKSTFVNVVQAILGEDYGQKAPRGMLMQKKHETHPTELADLFGRRFLGAIETEAGRRLAESLVKELTGGDRIRARRMKEDFWEFSPTHKVWLATNHKPSIHGDDNAIWRRVKLIPFTVTIPPAEQDRALLDKLQRELSGVLNWALSGCLAWQNEGLDEPIAVREANDKYRQDMDHLGQFIAECCLLGDQFRAGATELINVYHEWGGRRLNRIQFRDRLAVRGIVKGRFPSGPMKGRNCYEGIGLLNTSEVSEELSGSPQDNA